VFFHFDFTASEADFLAFSYFNAFDSVHGKRRIRKNRLSFMAVIAALIVLVFLVEGWTVFSLVYAVLAGLYAVIYMLLYKKIIKRNIRKNMNRLKQIGKLPFDPVSTMEFYEDKMVEIGASTHLEQGYDILERICVVGDRYIYLYSNSMSAHVLLIPQVREQSNLEEFIHFISQKCNTIEYYEL